MFFFLSNVRVECSVVSRLFGAACQLWLESWRLEKRSRPPPTSESLQCRACVGRKFAKAGTRLPRTSKENRFRRRRRHSSNGSGSMLECEASFVQNFWQKWNKTRIQREKREHNKQYKEKQKTKVGWSMKLEESLLCISNLSESRLWAVDSTV